MMDKGIDILLPQFKMLRDQTEFFTHLYNWFMPFYLKNPHITEALGFVDEKRKFCKGFLFYCKIMSSRCLFPGKP